MSDLNPHEGNAMLFLQHDTFDAVQAQVEATLALSYEQRTSNLIAYWAAMTDLIRADESLSEHTQEIARATSHEIEQRLGWGTP